MHNLKQTLVALVLALAAFPCFSQELWRGAQEQMTREQVLGLFPEAAKPSKPDDLDAGKELLRVSATELYGKQFRDGYFFKRDKLVLVKLKPTEEMSETEAFALYDTMYKDQLATLGEPGYNDQKSKAEGGSRTAMRASIWTTSTGRVVLVAFAKDEKLSFMHLIFDQD